MQEQPSTIRLPQEFRRAGIFASRREKIRGKRPGRPGVLVDGDFGACLTQVFFFAKNSRVYITETCGVVVTQGELQLL